MTSKAPFANCDACPLKNFSFVPGDSLKADAKYWLVGESPGDIEVLTGKAFTGPTGDFLWNVLGQFGVTRDQCNVTNAVLCSPPKSDKGEILSAATACCRERLESELARADLPVLLMGKEAKVSAFGTVPFGTDVLTTIGRWAGKRLATYHPTYVFVHDPNSAMTFFIDLEKFFKGRRWPHFEPTF